MSINRLKKLVFFLVVSGVTCWVASWFFLSLELNKPFEHASFNKKLRFFIKERLVKVDSSPYTLRESSQELDGIIYVMGGSQESLKYRFKTAAELYRKGKAHKLMVLHDPGITEYDPKLERNLTNDEWAIRQLADFGVEKKDIEFISTKGRFLGTLHESEAVSDFISKRHYKRLILVSSPYHTMRVWITFSNLLSNDNVMINIYSSNESAKLRTLLMEYFKLISYKFIILPIHIKLLS